MIVNESTKDETFYLILQTLFVVHKNTCYKTSGQVQGIYSTKRKEEEVAEIFWCYIERKMGMFGSVSSLLTELCHKIYQIKTVGAATKLDKT